LLGKSQAQVRSPKPTATTRPPTSTHDGAYQALLVAGTSDPLSEFRCVAFCALSHTYGAGLEANRSHSMSSHSCDRIGSRLQRAAQDQNGLRIALTSKNQSHEQPLLDQQAPASSRTKLAPSLVLSPDRLNKIKRQSRPRARKPNTCQIPNYLTSVVSPGHRLHNQWLGRPLRSIGAQISGPSSSGGRGPGAMFCTNDPSTVNGVGAVQVRRPNDRRSSWCEAVRSKIRREKALRSGKSRLLYLLYNKSLSSQTLMGWDIHNSENDIQEYHDNLERLDQGLANIEKYIPRCVCRVEERRRR